MKNAILLIPMLVLGFVANCQTIEIDEVWAGHPVGFCLLTEGSRQYIAYYNADRHMVVGQRNLQEDNFHLHVMTPTSRETHGGTSTVLGWDSHNYVTLGIDRDGYIHLSGNMHVHPLSYFRSTEPHDISTLQQVMNMTGSLENRVTYPKFMTDRKGKLIFHYRDGGSGNGNEIYNIYSAESKSWDRLLDAPLTDGEGKMNAYQSQPTLMADGWYHVWWVWRDTPDCATNHDLSYMKSPDLKNWYNAFGEPVKLPATIRNRSLIVDPVPPGGGIINLSARLCLDENNKAVFIYHKYGPGGNLQLFVARQQGNSWVSGQITDWDYRWEFSGGGTIVVDVRLKDFLRRDDGYYEFSYWHVKQGNNTLLLDGDFHIVGKVPNAETFSETVKVEGDFPGLEVRIAGDIGKADEKDAAYFLKWESLSSNRDRPRPEPWPGPAKLYLYKTTDQSETPSKIDFNRDWTFVKSSAEWPVDFDSEGKVMEALNLPHTWNASDMGPGLLDPYIGRAWYEKQFKAPVLTAGQRLLIRFEGINNCSKVWINGGYAGGRDGGFLANMIDVTDFLINDKNTILVRVDNSYDMKAGMPQWIGWNRYGGITQPVWMHIREHAYISNAGIEIRTPEFSGDSALTIVKTHIEETKKSGAELEVRHTLYSPEGERISSTTKSVRTGFFTNHVEVELPAVIKPNLWSDCNPALYKLKTEILEDEVIIDTQENSIGYRYFKFDSSKGFTLNGKPTKLRGVNMHMFFPGLGNALPERFYREDIKLLKQMGCNYMRSSHYPRTKEVLDACDELGIMVLEEQPYWHGSVRATGGEEAINHAVRLLKDMVRQQGNHPSIIAWNTVNEVMIAPPYKPGYGYFSMDDPERETWKLKPEEYPYLRRHLQRMVEAFKELDPDRPVSMVVGGQWEKNDRAGLTSVADIVAYNGGAMYLDDEFLGRETGKYYEFKPDYYRELFPERIHIMSEGILNHFTYARGEWEKEEEGWRWNAKYWNIINERPWFCGGSMWCFTDYSYLSPMVVDRFTDNSGISHHDLHGAVDRFRLPKEVFYFYEAMWSDHPVLHILGHWNHKKGSSQDVVIFTNCRDVELTLNGRSLGKGTPSSDEFPAIENPPLIWKNVRYKKGKLEARGMYDDQHLTDTRTSSGDPAGIVLSASNDLMADGRDISFIEMMICDIDGNRCYTVTDSISLTVSGPARLAGDRLVHVSGGLARVAIRSGGESRKITIIAEGDKLKRGELFLRAE